MIKIEFWRSSRMFRFFGDQNRILAIKPVGILKSAAPPAKSGVIAHAQARAFTHVHAGNAPPGNSLVWPLTLTPHVPFFSFGPELPVRLLGAFEMFFRCAVGWIWANGWSSGGHGGPCYIFLSLKEICPNCPGPKVHKTSFAA